MVVIIPFLIHHCGFATARRHFAPAGELLGHLIVDQLSLLVRYDVIRILVGLYGPT